MQEMLPVIYFLLSVHTKSSNMYVCVCVYIYSCIECGRGTKMIYIYRHTHTYYLIVVCIDGNKYVTDNEPQWDTELSIKEMLLSGRWDLRLSRWLLTCRRRGIGFWRHMYLQFDADFSEKHTVSIFSGWSAKAGNLSLQPPKMEAACFSKTSASTCNYTRCQNLRPLQQHYNEVIMS
jgi:hypothetical protein